MAYGDLLHKENGQWVFKGNISPVNVDWNSLVDVPTVLVWKGTWVSGTDYKTNDVVTFDGSAYVATVNNTTTVSPNSDRTTWSVLAQGPNPNGLPALYDYSIVASGSYQIVSTSLPAGNYTIHLYYRTLNPGAFSCNFTYTDGSGLLQTSILTSGFVPPGTYRTNPSFINVEDNTVLSIYVNADTANNVFVSLSIREM